MIAPSNRLIAAGFLLLLPATVLGGVIALALVPAIVWITALCCVAVIDLLAGRARRPELQIRVPEKIAAQRGQSFEFWAEALQSSRKPVQVRFAVAWPANFRFQPAIFEDVLGSTKLTWHQTVSGPERGVFHLSRAFFDSASPLGLWRYRQSVPLKTEIRIYPGLRSEARKMARFLVRGASGWQRQPRVGRGREFEKLREYEAGDGFDTIHWKATAKRRFPVTKVFQVEQAQEVYVIVDASRLSSRRALFRSELEPESILERTLAAGLLFGAVAERQGDKFGMAIISDQVERFVPASNGSAHFNRCRDLLCSVYSREVAPDFAEITATLLERLRRRSLLVFFISLDDPVVAEDFLRSVGHLTKRHLVLLLILCPPGVEPLFSKRSISTEVEMFDRIGGHLRWAGLAELGRRLTQAGVHFKLVNSETVSVEAASSYLNLKRRQLL
jgi:uncharacterized protein (DUF58 family)